jgi:hypothetical protein
MWKEKGFQVQKYEKLLLRKLIKILIKAQSMKERKQYHVHNLIGKPRTKIMAEKCKLNSPLYRLFTPLTGNKKKRDFLFM